MDEVKDATESPLFVAPIPEDSQIRTVGMRTDKTPAAVVDPEAPFGWMDDPTAPGGRRPKKAPGRQRTKTPATAPPAKRASNKPRVAAKVSDAVAIEDRPIGQKVAELVNGVWMLTAAVPVVDAKVMGRDLKVPTMRLKAQGALIRRNMDALVAGGSQIAANSEPVGRFVDKMTGAAGAGWILPAMFALAPFVAQTAQLWRGGLGDVEEALAQETHNQWAEVIAQAQAAAQVEPALAGAA